MNIKKLLARRRQAWKAAEPKKRDKARQSYFVALKLQQIKRELSA
jgi:hypothetical protein